MTRDYSHSGFACLKWSALDNRSTFVIVTVIIQQCNFCILLHTAMEHCVHFKRSLKEVYKSNSQKTNMSTCKLCGCDRVEIHKTCFHFINRI